MLPLFFCFLHHSPRGQLTFHWRPLSQYNLVLKPNFSQYMVFSQEVSFLVSWDGALQLKVSASNLGKVAFSVTFKSRYNLNESVIEKLRQELATETKTISVKCCKHNV